MGTLYSCSISLSGSLSINDIDIQAPDGHLLQIAAVVIMTEPADWIEGEMILYHFVQFVLARDFLIFRQISKFR
jgi:hypothetical protein